MANNVFHEHEQRKPIFYSCPTPSNPPTPLLPSTSRPPLSHIQGQATIDDDDEYFNSIPPGHKFVPTDYELIVYYLEKKLQNLPLPRNKITEVNLYDHHPQDLAEQYKNRNQQQYWYFFTPRDRKYKNGTRPNRAAGNGYWKATGADREVRHNGHVLGLRKSLVYYVGKPPKGEKTNWIMHEFRMKDPPKPTGSNNMKLDDWVLCRIEHKNEKRGKNQREDSVSNEDDADMNENNLMVTPVADHSSLVNHYDCSLINYSNPSPNGFNPAFNDDNNVEDVSSQHESMHLNTTTQESFNPAFNDGNNVENVSSQHESNSNDSNDVLYTGIFDDIDPSSFTLPDKFN